MNMLSFLWPRLREEDLTVDEWQAPVSTRDMEAQRIEPSLFPAELLDQRRKPLNLSIDHEAIAFNDRYQHLRANNTGEDPAELLLALIKALRAKQNDPRQAGQASALHVAWQLRKLDIEDLVETEQDAALINAILQRRGTLS